MKTCIPCLNLPASFDRIHSIWPFRNQVKELLVALKYKAAHPLLKPLGKVLANYLSNSSFDMIVPIPSSKEQLRRRGFQHTSLLARAIKLAPVKELLVHRKINNRPQVEVPIEERKNNISGAFQLQETTELFGQNVLLLDDVTTTSATMIEAASLLKASGAKEITGLTLARSPHFQANRLRLALAL